MDASDTKNTSDSGTLRASSSAPSSGDEKRSAKKRGRLRPSEAAPILSKLIQERLNALPSSSKVLEHNALQEVEVDKLEMSPDQKQYVVPAIAEHDYVINPAIAEHDYVARPPPEETISATDQEEAKSDSTESADEGPPQEIWMDHNYCMPPKFSDFVSTTDAETTVEEKKPQKENKRKRKGTSVAVKSLSDKDIKSETLSEGQTSEPVPSRKKAKKTKEIPLSDITQTFNYSRGSRELANLLQPAKIRPKFKCRTIQEENEVFFNVFRSGVDAEDVNYLKRTYDMLLQSEDPQFYWLNDILWVDHPHTNIPDPVQTKRRRKGDDLPPWLHKSG